MHILRAWVIAGTYVLCVSTPCLAQKADLSATSPIQFPPVTQGGNSVTTFTLTNSDKVNALTGIVVTLAGANFSQANTCGASLAANTSCTFTVTFSPTSLGIQNGSISIADNAAGAPQVINLSGRGVPKYTFSISNGAAVSVGGRLSIVITAVDNANSPLNAYGGTVTVSSSDGAAILPTSAVNIVTGIGSVNVTFITPGAQSLIVSDGTVSSLVSVTVGTSVSGCSSCYAAVGAGAGLFPTKNSDYNNVQNIIQKTHLGRTSPQYLVGLSYRLPWRGIFDFNRLDCGPGEFFNPTSEARAAYCYPFKAFVSLKFSPDASQTFTGFTFGMSHALHKNLDMLLGLSYTPYSEISDGFRAAATNVFTTQTTAKNPCYSQYSLAQLQDVNQYDGFPTQLVTNTGTAAAPICTAGAQIYSGSPLIVHYHAGFFLGLAFPIGFKSFFGAP